MFKILFNCKKCSQPIEYERTNRQISGHSVQCKHCRTINKVWANEDKVKEVK
jgi:hypothetical protein